MVEFNRFGVRASFVIEPIVEIEDLLDYEMLHDELVYADTGVRAERAAPRYDHYVKLLRGPWAGFYHTTAWHEEFCRNFELLTGRPAVDRSLETMLDALNRMNLKSREYNPLIESMIQELLTKTA